MRLSAVGELSEASSCVALPTRLSASRRITVIVEGFNKKEINEHDTGSEKDMESMSPCRCLYVTSCF